MASGSELSSKFGLSSRPPAEGSQPPAGSFSLQLTYSEPERLKVSIAVAACSANLKTLPE